MSASKGEEEQISQRKLLSVIMAEACALAWKPSPRHVAKEVVLVALTKQLGTGPLYKQGSDNDSNLKGKDAHATAPATLLRAVLDCPQRLQNLPQCPQQRNRYKYTHTHLQTPILNASNEDPEQTDE